MTAKTKRKTARLFWTDRSQAIRLPKEFRFEGDSVFVRKEGNTVVIEPNNGWPEGYFESLGDVSDDFVRPPQGKLTRRKKL